MQRRLFARSLSVGIIALIAVFGIAPAEAQDSSKNLVVGLDFTSNPYIIAQPDGTATGFNVDLVTEVARRLGRPGVTLMDQQFAGIFAGLDAGKYEFIAAPVTLTEERSEAMLFIEGYIATNLQFVTRKGDSLKTLDVLRGKSVAVNNGSAQEQYLETIHDQYGFTISKYGANADAFQAVLSGRDFAAISGDGNVLYAAAHNPQLAPAYVVDTGNVFSWAFRKDDEATRTRVERVMECMKLDGFVAKTYAKWFGALPPDNSPSVTVYAGIGQPGKANFLRNYDAPVCSK